MNPEQKLQQAIDNPSLETYAGSRVYGTARPNSDVDKRGFCIPPKEYLLGLYNDGGGQYRFEQEVKHEEEDRVIFSILKFLKLLLKCNSFALELLYAPDKSIITIDSTGVIFREHREKFLSKQLYKPFSGFALSEWRKCIGQTTGNLGKRRKEDIKRYTYTPKNAYHALRLLSQAEELLTKGFLTLPRPDAEFLMSVRNAEPSLKELKCLFNKADEKVKRAYDNSCLPKHPDYKFVNTLIKMVFNS